MVPARRLDSSSPAKSTRYMREVRDFAPPPAWLSPCSSASCCQVASTRSINTACERLECALARVEPVVRPSMPRRSSASASWAAHKFGHHFIKGQGGLVFSSFSPNKKERYHIRPARGRSTGRNAAKQGSDVKEVLLASQELLKT